MQTVFKGEGFPRATTKRPACAEVDGLGHYKGYRLGFYLAHGFLRRRATVGLLPHKCESSCTSRVLHPPHFSGDGWKNEIVRSPRRRPATSPQVPQGLRLFFDLDGGR